MSSRRWPRLLGVLLGTVLLLSLSGVLPRATGAPRSSEVRVASFYSHALDRTMPYLVYLPPGYRHDDTRYPVLYMLHGRDAGYEQWQSLGLLDSAERLIISGEIAPLVIVLPQGDFGYWMNHAGGGPRWGDYVAHDLVAHIDGSYRTRTDAAQRAIGGLSMGGHGALQLALNHPGLFAAVGGHSAVFRNEQQAFPFFGTGEAFRQRDPLALVRAASQVRFAIWLDIGANDPWRDTAASFHTLLRERGIMHRWQVLPGDHGSGYWASNVAEYLRWYDAMLRA